MGSKIRILKKQTIYKFKKINYQVSEWSKKVKLLESFWVTIFKIFKFKCFENVAKFLMSLNLCNFFNG